MITMSFSENHLTWVSIPRLPKTIKKGYGRVRFFSIITCKRAINIEVAIDYEGWSKGHLSD